MQYLKGVHIYLTCYISAILLLSQNILTVNSQFFEPPSETEIDLKSQIVWEIWGKIAVLDWE